VGRVGCHHQQPGSHGYGSNPPTPLPPFGRDMSLNLVSRQELVSTKPELVKARHSFTRAIAAYRAGGNPEGEAYARQAFDRVTKHLKEEHKYVWGSEEVEAFQQLLTMRE